MQRELQNLWTKKIKTPEQQNRKSNIKILARSGNRTWDLSQPSRMCYLWTTQSFVSMDSCQAFKLFQRNGPKRK